MTTATFDATAPDGAAVAVRFRRLPIRALVVAGGALFAIATGAAWIAWPAHAVSTDDAYVKADSTIVAPKVQGLIARVLVRDNQSVKAGQPLIEIDPEDYRQAVAAAEAEVSSAEAALAEQDAQQRVAAANARAASAVIGSAEAEAERAAADDKRFTALSAAGDVSRRLADQMRATAISAAADVKKSRAAFAAALQQEEAVAWTRGTLEAALAKANAALSLARQNNSHTLIRAPVAGVVGDRQAQVGEYVQAGTQLMTIVPMNTIYLTANFKETQTERMLTGQRAEFSVDALPGKTFHGEVESFAPGAGSEFSLLPYEPATGNFTRIVQRVPVRIRLDRNQPGLERLRPGLSADVTVTLSN